MELIVCTDGETDVKATCSVCGKAVEGWYSPIYRTDEEIDLCAKLSILTNILTNNLFEEMEFSICDDCLYEINPVYRKSRGFRYKFVVNEDEICKWLRQKIDSKKLIC